MIKNSLLSLILLLIMIFENSCIKNGCDSPKLPYQVLTDSIKVWLPYTSNKSLVFEDADLVKDTILLQDFFSGDDEIWRGDECPFGKGQFVRCNFYDPATADTILAEIGRVNQLLIDRKSTHLVFDGNVNKAFPTNSTADYVEAIVLNGKTFRNCIWSACTASADCVESGITKFYFAKQLGLVAYVKNDILYTLK